MSLRGRFDDDDDSYAEPRGVELHSDACASCITSYIVLRALWREVRREPREGKKSRPSRAVALWKSCTKPSRSIKPRCHARAAAAASRARGPLLSESFLLQERGKKSKFLIPLAGTAIIYMGNSCQLFKNAVRGVLQFFSRFFLWKYIPKYGLPPIFSSLCALQHSLQFFKCWKRAKKRLF